MSRIWILQRYKLALLFHWHIGFPAILDVGVSVVFNTLIVAGLVLMPFNKLPAMWFALLLLTELTYTVVRIAGTTAAVIVEGDSHHWTKMLAVPFSGIYHILFNVMSTMYGFAQEVFWKGLNTGFTPESTLVLGNTSRIALFYRVQRCLLLALRAVRYGDVPLGAFWLGWRETQWTRNGYEGWSSKTRPSSVKQPQPVLVDEPSRPSLIDLVMPASDDVAALESVASKEPTGLVMADSAVVRRIPLSPEHMATLPYERDSTVPMGA